MAAEQYRCPRCQAAISATEVDSFISVYPPGVEPNSSGDGKATLRVRPGSVLCENSAHETPCVMRREKIDVHHHH